MNSDGMGDNGINRFRCGKLTVRTAELPMCYAKSADHTGADGNKISREGDRKEKTCPNWILKK